MALRYVSSFVYSVLAAASLLLANHVVAYLRLRRALKRAGIYRYRSILDPRLSGRAPIIDKFDVPGPYAAWHAYEKAGSTIVSCQPLIGSQIPHYYTCDADAIKLISTDVTMYHKQIESMRMIAFYGPNIITTEFDEWKRHRKVAKTAFSEGNIRLVWVESSTIVKEWLDALDGEMSGGLEIHIDAIEQIKRLTRLVIQSAAFGYRSSWAEDSHSVPPPGHKITIREAVAEAAELIVEKAISPRWLYYLPIPFLYPRLARTEVAYGELSKYFKEMIRNAKAEGLGQKEIDLNEAKEGIGADLFRRLIVANETEGTLSDDELLSNVFVFYIAGHGTHKSSTPFVSSLLITVLLKTTAYSLSYTIAYLAMYPQAQRNLYKEVSNVWPDNEFPEDLRQSFINDYPKLEYTLATFREAQRLGSITNMQTKVVASDTVLRGSQKPFSDDTFEVPVSKGSRVNIDIRAIHRAPIYWGDDAEEFRPERFIDTETYKWPREAFLPFGLGPRMCIGLRFATVEAVCTLAHLVRHFEILLPEHLVGKSLEEQKAEMLKWKKVLTMNPTNLKVRFRRRM